MSGWNSGQKKILVVLFIEEPSILPPNHLVDNANVGLNDFHDLGGNIFVCVVWDRCAVVLIVDKFYRGVHALEETFFVDSGEDKAGFVEGFGALGAGADADCRERMTYAGEETGLFWEGAAVGDYREGVHLKAVIVVEAERFVWDYPAVQLEA